MNLKKILIGSMGVATLLSLSAPAFAATKVQTGAHPKSVVVAPKATKAAQKPTVAPKAAKKSTAVKKPASKPKTR